jgi:LuxR family transcriptional regulator, maltose regulon positive regulatory protein
VAPLARPARAPALPELGTGHVARPRLVGMLEQAAPLALVIAPAGFGKTALVAEWAASSARQFAWLSVSRADNDPERFVPRVGQALADAQVLVLDDVHVLDAPAALGVLRQLIARLPQLVLVGRRAPGVPLARLRAQRAVTELGSRELTMSDAESAALLSGCGVERVSVPAEGWPAVLYLAAAGASVDAYVREEVLAPLDNEVHEFLVRASVLDRPSAGACDAVLERADSARMLAWAAESTLLLRQTRWHPVLRDALRAELRRADPALWRELHGRACEWHLRQGDRERAIEHAVAADDVPRAVDLVTDVAGAYITHGRNDDVRRMLAVIPRGAIESTPRLALAAAASRLAAGDVAEARRCEPAARNQVLGAALADDGLGMAAGFHLLEGVALSVAGDSGAAATRLEAGARVAAIDAPALQALCLAQLALVAAERGDWDGAAVSASRAVAQVEHYRLDRYPTSALVFAASALVRSRRGMLDAARADLRNATRRLRTLGEFIAWYDAEARLAVAGAMVRVGDAAHARAYVEEAREAAQRVPGATALMAWVDAAEREVDAALAALVDGSLSLTGAEMRVLSLLPTHLSFREIAGRLCVSANTIKTQAHSVYRKLEASSRSEAVLRAGELGLLGREP